MVRLAATVMLVRPSGERAFEVLLLRRSQASHFVPDAYVFPGGTVDARDGAPETAARIRGADGAALRRLFRGTNAPQFPVPFAMPEPAQAAALLVAALRELYEEAGVLLACDDAGRPLSGAQVHVPQRREAFVKMLEDLDVYGNAGALELFSHWITPPTYPKRYNTFFFAALASPEQIASADAVETHDGVWMTPQRALERYAAGDLRLVYPTIKHLERLAKFEDANELMRFAREKPIYSIMPDASGDAQFSMPPDLEFAW